MIIWNINMAYPWFSDDLFLFSNNNTIKCFLRVLINLFRVSMASLVSELEDGKW